MQAASHIGAETGTSARWTGGRRLGWRGGKGIAAAVVTLVALGGYAWWATSLRPFTAPSLAATVAGWLAAVAAGSGLGSRLQRPAGEASARGLAVWAALAIALGAWELAAYLQHPRSQHPTLSSLANSALDSHPVRALAFMAWVGITARLARR